jgi:hypothetical protein
MRNSIRNLVESSELRVERSSEEKSRLEYFLTRRPEQLSVEEFIELTQLIQTISN